MLKLSIYHTYNLQVVIIIKKKKAVKKMTVLIDNLLFSNF